MFISLISPSINMNHLRYQIEVKTKLNKIVILFFRVVFAFMKNQ